MKDQNVIFMLMDDLVIQPILAISVITLINKFNIKQVGASQEIVVEFGMNEVRLICPNIIFAWKQKFMS